MDLCTLDLGLGMSCTTEPNTCSGSESALSLLFDEDDGDEFDTRNLGIVAITCLKGVRDGGGTRSRTCIGAVFPCLKFRIVLGATSTLVDL